MSRDFHWNISDDDTTERFSSSGRSNNRNLAPYYSVQSTNMETMNRDAFIASTHNSFNWPVDSNSFTYLYIPTGNAAQFLRSFVRSFVRVHLSICVRRVQTHVRRQ